MTMVRGRQEDRQGPEPEVEGEIRELVRRDVAQLRKPESAGEMGVSNLNALIQRVSGTSVLEIEKLIAELQRLRDYLQHEGQRVQREITEYAHMSQAATKSTRIIAESLAQWKQSAESRNARG
jgi:PleD family two-component response regulator